MHVHIPEKSHAWESFCSGKCGHTTHISLLPILVNLPTIEDEQFDRCAKPSSPGALSNSDCAVPVFAR
jgi:hypothetical protein